MTVLCHHCGERAQADFAFCEACGKRLLPVQETGEDDPQQVPSARSGHTCADASPIVCLCGGTVLDASRYCEVCGRCAAAVHAPELVALGDCAASASHRGLRHADNQDAVGMLLLPGGLALAVADGVSTACHARTAADLACSEALATLREFASVAPQDRLALAVKRAHAAICKLPYDAVHMAEPQATIVLALVEGQQIWFAWVGDSRLYVMDATQARQLTVDDSWLNEQLGKGTDPAEAKRDENAHCITQCLGMRDEEPAVHLGQYQLASGQSVLLCSDGLWNYVDSPTVLAELLAGKASGSLAKTCAALVDFANAAGGHDNITVALYRPGSDDPAV
jgi:serine/threonine protein phosphatase PrpC